MDRLANVKNKCHTGVISLKEQKGQSAALLNLCKESVKTLKHGT